MATRVIKSLPAPGTVSRAKIRAAVKAVKQNSTKRKDTRKKVTITNRRTASGRKLIGFRKPAITSPVG